jgi:hypothetical protein
VQRLMDGSSNSSSNSSNVVDGAVEARPSTAAVASLCPPAPPSSNAATTTTTTTAATAKSGGNNTNNNNNGDNHHGDVPPCVHYERKCDIVAPCCHRPYGCRICHDEMSPACGTMDRFAISVIMCRRCKRRQCSKTNECESCRASFAEYHCPKCNLWMSTDKDPFHCELCGICRVGGRENYRHCDTCCMCVSASVYDTHSCECTVSLSVLAGGGGPPRASCPPILCATAMGCYFPNARFAVPSLVTPCPPPTPPFLIFLPPPPTRDDDDNGDTAITSTYQAFRTSTRTTARCAARTCSPRANPPRTSRAGTPSTSTASATSPGSTGGARYARRL